MVSQDFFWFVWENMHQVSKLEAKSKIWRFGHTFCIISFVRYIPFPRFLFKFHSKNILYFFAYVAVVPPLLGCQLSVYTGISKFQATSSVALQAQLAS